MRFETVPSSWEERDWDRKFRGRSVLVIFRQSWAFLRLLIQLPNETFQNRRFLRIDDIKRESDDCFNHKLLFTFYEWNWFPWTFVVKNAIILEIMYFHKKDLLCISFVNENLFVLKKTFFGVEFFFLLTFLILGRTQVVMLSLLHLPFLLLFKNDCCWSRWIEPYYLDMGMQSW